MLESTNAPLEDPSEAISIEKLPLTPYNSVNNVEDVLTLAKQQRMLAEDVAENVTRAMSQQPSSSMKTPTVRRITPGHFLLSSRISTSATPTLFSHGDRLSGTCNGSGSGGTGKSIPYPAILFDSFQKGQKEISPGSSSNKKSASIILKDLEQRHLTLLRECEAAENEKNKSSEEYGRLVKSIANAENKLQELERELKKTKQEIEMNKSISEMLTAESGSKAVHLENLKATTIREKEELEKVRIEIEKQQRLLIEQEILQQRIDSEEFNLSELLKNKLSAEKAWEETKTKLSKIESELSDSEAALAALKIELQKNKNLNTETESQLADKRRAVEEVDASLEQKSYDLYILYSEIATTNANLAAQKRIVEDLESRCKAAELELQCINAMLDTTTSEHCRAKDQLTATEYRIRIAVDRETEVNERMDQAEMRAQQAEERAAVLELRACRAEKDAEILELKSKEIKYYEQEIDKLRKKIGEMQDISILVERLKALQIEKESLQLELVNTQQDNEKLQEQLQLEIDEKQSYRDKSKNLENILIEDKEKWESFTARQQENEKSFLNARQDMHDHIETLEFKLSDALQQNNILTGKIQDLQKHLEASTTQAEKLQNDLNETDDSALELRQQISQLSEALDVSQKERKKSENLISTLQLQVEELQDRLKIEREIRSDIESNIHSTATSTDLVIGKKDQELACFQEQNAVLKATIRKLAVILAENLLEKGKSSGKLQNRAILEELREITGIADVK